MNNKRCHLLHKSLLILRHNFLHFLTFNCQMYSFSHDVIITREGMMRNKNMEKAGLPFLLLSISKDYCMRPFCLIKVFVSIMKKSFQRGTYHCSASWKDFYDFILMQYFYLINSSTTSTRCSADNPNSFSRSSAGPE